MASAVDVCNLALAHLGEEGSIAGINPPEGSTYANEAGRFYSLARDIVLAEHQWNFATRRVSLSQVTNDSDLWQYAYAYPSNCLRPVAIVKKGQANEADVAEFVIETNATGGQVIYTNEPDACLRFIRLVTDTTKFTPHFVDALAYLLASYLAGPITKDANLKRTMTAAYVSALGLAKKVDSNARKLDIVKDHQAEWTRARGHVAQDDSLAFLRAK